MSPYIACALIGAAIGAGATWRVEEWRADHTRLEAIKEASRIDNKRASVNAGLDKSTAAQLEQHHVVTETIIKEVVKYVPLDSPAVPGGFRVLHDAAVTRQLPDPARVADAAAVPLADAAATVVDNYAACTGNAIRLEGLQRWVREQGAVK